MSAQAINGTPARSVVSARAESAARAVCKTEQRINDLKHELSNLGYVLIDQKATQRAACRVLENVMGRRRV